MVKNKVKRLHSQTEECIKRNIIWKQQWSLEFSYPVTNFIFLWTWTCFCSNRDIEFETILVSLKSWMSISPGMFCPGLQFCMPLFLFPCIYFAWRLIYVLSFLCHFYHVKYVMVKIVFPKSPLNKAILSSANKMWPNGSPVAFDLMGIRQLVHMLMRTRSEDLFPTYLAWWICGGRRGTYGDLKAPLEKRGAPNIWPPPTRIRIVIKLEINTQIALKCPYLK